MNFEYESRIQNINMINEKIRCVLKSEKKPMNSRTLPDNQPSINKRVESQNISPIKIIEGSNKKPTKLNKTPKPATNEV